jgi:hypothetical protein
VQKNENFLLNPHLSDLLGGSYYLSEQGLTQATSQFFVWVPVTSSPETPITSHS